MKENNLQNYMTVVLNAPALERLLGDMTDAQVLSLKQAAMEQFMKKRVKALVPDTAGKVIDAEIRRLVGEEIGTITNYPYKVTINPNLSTYIANVIKERVASTLAEVKEEIVEAVGKELREQTEKLKKFIEVKVKNTVTAETGKAITEGVNARLRGVYNAISEATKTA